MADTYTTRNRFEKPEPGAYLDTWGTRLNGQFGSDLLDVAADGVLALTVSGSVTLTTANGSTDQARYRAINMTGTGGTVTIPNVEKAYLVRNATSGTVTLTTGSGTSAVIQAGSQGWFMSTGSNAVYFSGGLSIYLEGTFTPVVNFGGGTTGITYSNQGGRYNRVGDMVFIELLANLSNKGSSTGAATITGLPYTANGSVPQGIFSILMDATATVTVPLARIIQGTNYVTLENFASNAATALTNSNFTNSTAIGISGCYHV